MRVPNADWIASDREGITICDATSAAFAMDLAWDKLDVTTFSWQKVLGGEAAHGMIVLSPRAVARLESYTPPWPLPKIFRLTKGGKLNEAIFEGETINTPSMLALEDYLDALGWAEGIGGLKALQARANANFAALSAWVDEEQLGRFPRRRRVLSLQHQRMPEDHRSRVHKARRRCALRNGAEDRAVLEAEGVAFDIAGHRNAPPGLRIWCGATVETAEIEALTPWLDWAWAQVRG